MTPGSAIAAAVALTLLGGGAAPGPVPADLLKRLADSDAQLSRLYREGGVTMSSEAQEMNRAGTVHHAQELVVRLSRKEGQSHSEVVRAVRDGQDVTQAEQAQVKQQREKAAEQPKAPDTANASSAAPSTPFGADQQPRYAFAVLGPDASDPTKLRVGFQPREASGDVWRGEAVVDPEGGVVWWMKQSPAKLPFFVDRMDVVMEFFTRTPLGNAVSSVRIEGEGGFPFFKKRFRTVTRFTEYQAP